MGGNLLASEAWLVEQWTAKLSSAVASMMGDTPAVTAGRAAEESPSGDEIVWWEQPFNVSPEARVWVGAPTLTWRTVGDEVLKSAGIEDADDPNIRSTFFEILNQSLASLAQALTARFRGEVTCEAGGETATPPSESIPVSITLGEATLALHFAAAKTLLELYDKSAAARTTSDPAPAPEGPTSLALTDDRGYPKGLDLLLDVELPLSVSFGHASLPIKDVIKLTTGSIVELNRSITEPVEIIVNNVVIARGEVVVIEGNFGVRIKQVISRQQRLRTLR